MPLTACKTSRAINARLAPAVVGCLHSQWLCSACSPTRLSSFSGGQPSAAPARPSAPAAPNTGAPGAGTGAGNLGDLLKGVLGGGAAGTALSGGLNDLLKQLQQNGQGDVANSWVGTGQNKAIAPKDLASALGADRINGLMAYSGMSREDMLSGLSKHLPNVVDKLTPEGRLPTEEEASRLI
jgi:uncharacterized protein YidB (DUF937 family)